MSALSPELLRLRRILAEKYQLTQESRTFLACVPMDTLSVAWSDVPLDRWQSILEAAIEQGMLDKLVESAADENPGDQELLRAKATLPFLNSTRQARRDDEERQSRESFVQGALAIDYSQQERLFMRRLGAKAPAPRARAFVICGEIEQGLYWLTHRLRRKIVSKEELQVFKHAFHPPRTGVKRTDLESFRRQLLRTLNGGGRLSGAVETQELFERVCDCLRTRSVVLLFDQTEFLKEQELNDFIQTFWHPLVDAVKAFEERADPGVVKSWLIAFFLHNGERPSAQSAGADTPTSSWDAKSPVLLPQLSTFDQDTLNQWAQGYPVPPCLYESETLQEIIEESAGVPLEVAMAIGERWPCSVSPWGIISNQWEQP